MDKQRRVVFSKSKLEDEDDPVVFEALRLGLLSRALLFDGDEVGKTLEVWRRSCEGDPLKPFFQQVRYIACQVDRNSPSLSALLSSISLLWNLQTLVIVTEVPTTFVAPSEIWEMRQLRHVNVLAITIPNPTPSDQQDDDLHNLQTLRSVVNLILSEEVCRRIPNIKKLTMVYAFSSGTISDYLLNNLRCFDKLESIRCEFKESAPDNLLPNLAFPDSLKKLYLVGSKLRWEDLTIIGSLPNLEVLSLRLNAVGGCEWNPIEGQFLRLKLLQMEFCPDFTVWNADKSHFPVLEELHIGRLDELNEIPLSIGDIPTLRDITVAWCSDSIAISAIEILEEQGSYGNEYIKLAVLFISKSKLARFKKKVEPDTLRNRNFQCLVHKP